MLITNGLILRDPAAPCSVPAVVHLMTKNPNVAAIDSAQFGMWLVSHLWGSQGPPGRRCILLFLYGEQAERLTLCIFPCRPDS